MIKVGKTLDGILMEMDFPKSNKNWKSASFEDDIINHHPGYLQRVEWSEDEDN